MSVYDGGYLLYSNDGGVTWPIKSTEATNWFKVEGTKVACTTWTTETECTDNGCYWYNDSCHSDPFFAHETFKSGYLRRFQNRQIFGHYSASGGGDLRGVAVNQSGHVLTDVEIDVSSGIHVVQESGAFVQISGQHVYVESGVYVASGLAVTVESGIQIIVDIPNEVIIHNSGNPLVVGAISGGVNILSGAIDSVVVKAVTSNSGDIYLGGDNDKPFSGQGMLLEAGEAVTINIVELGLIRACAEVSGDRITYLATG